MNAPSATMHKRKNWAAALSVGRFHKTRAPTEERATSRKNQRIDGTKSSSFSLPRRHQSSSGGESDLVNFTRTLKGASASSPSASSVFLAQSGSLVMSQSGSLVMS